VGIAALIDPRSFRRVSDDDGNRARAVKPSGIAFLRFPENRSQRARGGLASRREIAMATEVGARHKGRSGASKGMRESASNHEFNAFYRGSRGFFRCGIVFPQSPRYHRAQSGHEIDARCSLILPRLSFSRPFPSPASSRVRYRQPAVAINRRYLDAIPRENRIRLAPRYR